MKKVLVLGQTPPPYGGQAMMIRRLVEADFESIKIYHIRMAFSENFKELGKGGLKKILHLFSILSKAIYYKFRYNIKNIYYPPAGPNLNPIVRDILLLICLRFLFRTTIFHFRAAGLSEFISSSSGVLRLLAKLAYQKADLAIQLSSLNPPDGHYFKCKKLEVIHNGLEDEFQTYLNKKVENKGFIQILSVGVIREDKGIMVLLEALKKMNTKLVFKLVIMGEFSSVSFEKKVKQFISSNQMDNLVDFVGVKSGKDKWDLFFSSDIVCFPTFFDSESFGNVVVESMMFGKPVISTQWRGIPDIIQDNSNGLLVPPRDALSLANQIEFLIENPQERTRIGKNGRTTFLEKFQLKTHLLRMEESFMKTLI